MTAEENVTVARRYAALFSTGDLAALDEVVAPGHVMQVNGHRLPETMTIRSRITGWRLIFPDYVINIHETVAQGDTVVLRYTGTGTQHAELRLLGHTIPNSGKRMEYPAMMLLHIRDGRVVEECAVANLFSVVEHLVDAAV